MPTTDQFPLGATLTLEDLSSDLHTTLHQLRSTEPISWVPVINAWLVTRRQDTVDIMRDARTFTVDHPGFSTAQVVGPSMLSLDGAQHQRHRRPFELPFRKREVDKRFDQPVTHSIGTLLDEIAPHGQAELRRAFAGPVAVKTMVTALGLQDIGVVEVLRWYDAIVDAVTRVSAGEAVSEAGKAAYAALSASLMPALKGDGPASLLAQASGMADGLSDKQIISNAAVLLFGGIETTEGMIANALYHLLTNPMVLAKVRANPSLIPAVVEESLRMEPAAAVVDRYATQQVQMGNATIKEGDLIQVSLAGANRDPDYFPNPDHFDPTRPNLQAHVTFAQGPHVCLGIHLARLEAQLALQEIVARLPELRLEPAGLQEAIPRGLIFRKPTALNARWA